MAVIENIDFRGRMKDKETTFSRLTEEVRRKHPLNLEASTFSGPAVRNTFATKAD